jgi:hypothetical protein
MISRIRSTLAIALCLMLALTGQSMAVVRGASVATGQMVICIGTQTVTVFTDAEGEPTAAPHICPDCVMSTLGPVPAVHVAAVTVIVSDATWMASSDTMFAPEPAKFYHSRAPPVSV